MQVYVSQREPSINRPVKELKGFKKVVLKKGETQTVEVEIERKYAASFWDEIRDSWIVEKGTYDVLVGNSTDEESGVKLLVGSFEVQTTSWWKGL